MKTNPIPAKIPVQQSRKFSSGFEAGNGFKVSYQPSSSGMYQIYVFGPIEDAVQFIDAIEVLGMAGENDIVIINLSSPGGNLDATDTFIHAMRECEARIIVKATGGVHSAGSVILLNADEFILSENFNCLIHNGEVGFGAKFSDWKAATKHTAEYMERLMRTTYKGFLEDSEIDALLAGKDFWLNAPDFMARWNKREALLEAIEN